MSEKSSEYVGYEYMEVPAKKSMESLYADSYQNFGWQHEASDAVEGKKDSVQMRFKRDRVLRNKAELTRLQRQFESDVHEIEHLEQSKTTAATIIAIVIGLVGTVFLGLSMFAYLNNAMSLMIILAVPGFLGWILPYFCYKKIKQVKTDQIDPLIGQKQDEIYVVCEQANRLLTA